VEREPIGVVAAITPWNFPLHQIVAKLAPAIATGCTIVVKPAELSSLSAVELFKVIDDIGLPPGVVNLVCGHGAVIGEALVRHPRVDMVSFTGSTRAGRRVGELAIGDIKKIALELGGKSATVLLDDADVDKAVSSAVGSCFLNNGQMCSALTRLIVLRSQLPRVEEVLVQSVAKFAPGDPMDSGTRLGPLASATQQDTVLRYIQTGIAEGARVLVGGAERPAGTGYYVQPTVLTDVTSGMTVAQEEIFGPVLVVIPVDSEEQALAAANDSPYGLSGAVWSADPERAASFARGMRTGQVMINKGAFNARAPFGGYKKSGIGRELGKFGLEEYLEYKALVS
ncbi:MAG: aldehyde dehydrogenase family protein, partial [Candidatus Nanopelagicales bacterium]